jgi:hypothetical protein
MYSLPRRRKPGHEMYATASSRNEVGFCAVDNRSGKVFDKVLDETAFVRGGTVCTLITQVFMTASGGPRLGAYGEKSCQRALDSKVEASVFGLPLDRRLAYKVNKTLTNTKVVSRRIWCRERPNIHDYGRLILCFLRDVVSRHLLVPP